eukprot:1023558-Prymnesium_polylepis.1
MGGQSASSGIALPSSRYGRCPVQNSKSSSHRNALTLTHAQNVWLTAPLLEAQLLSLRKIAEEMLQHTPAYRGQAVALIVPGHLLQQKLNFPAPTVLYASPNNLGANEAVIEMAAGYENISVTHDFEMLPSVYVY